MGGLLTRPAEALAEKAGDEARAYGNDVQVPQLVANIDQVAVTARDTNASIINADLPGTTEKIRTGISSVTTIASHTVPIAGAVALLNTGFGMRKEQIHIDIRQTFANIALVQHNDRNERAKIPAGMEKAQWDALFSIQVIKPLREEQQELLAKKPVIIRIGGNHKDDSYIYKNLV